MILTAKQILERGIIYLSEANAKKYGVELEPAQMGIDLHMVSCAKVTTSGFIPKKGKTKVAGCERVEPVLCEDEKLVWHLEPGDYEIGFAEGCNFDSKTYATIVHRSSLRRCGVVLNSPGWDPGFHCEEMGTFMHVNVPITIEVGARVGQINVWESSEEAEEYSGQYQGKGVLEGKH